MGKPMIPTCKKPRLTAQCIISCKPPLSSAFRVKKYACLSLLLYPCGYGRAFAAGDELTVKLTREVLELVALLGFRH